MTGPTSAPQQTREKEAPELLPVPQDVADEREMARFLPFMTMAGAPPPPPPEPRHVLALQRKGGNRAASRFVSRLHEAHAAQATVQRDGGTVDEEAALVKAVQLANKNSLAKVKLPIKATPGLKVFGALEVKKVEFELDVTGEFKSPQLSGAGGPKVSGGAQNVGVKETNATDAKRTEARAAVYAMELEQKFGHSPFEEMFSWKVGGEYGSYTPTDALAPNKREFKGKLGLKMAAEGWSFEIEFAPIAYDAKKSGADAWKVLSTTIKVAKEFSVASLPRAINIGGATVDATLKAKLTGSIEVGPDFNATARILGKFMPKEKIAAMIAAAAPKIAKEESDRFVEQMVKEMVEARLEHISDPAVRTVVEREARKRLAEEIATREAAIKLAEECSFFIRREMVEKAQSEAGIAAISVQADVIVRKTAQEFLSGSAQAKLLREAIAASIKQTIKEISLKTAAKKVAQSLIPGPADFVLVGVEILYNYVDTALKDIEIKELGLKTLAVRDNYVAGYTDGLRGGGAGGGASAGPAGGGNFEGAAHLLGLAEGGKMFDQTMALLAKQSGGTADELKPYVVEEMANLPVNRAEIIAKAAPELKKMMMDGLTRKYSGGVLRFLFGHDFKGSKDYENFERMIDSFLKEGAGNVTIANLANGVKLKLIMLDSTSDRAQRFRTSDGRFSDVTISGDTDAYSGWVTADGTPLEKIYTSQDSADESESAEGEAKRIEAHKRALAAGSLKLSGKYNVIAFSVSSASLSGVPDDLTFKEFLRSPTFQGMTVFGSGVTTTVSGTCTWTHELFDQLDEDVTVEFEGTVTPGKASVTVTHDTDHPELTAGSWASDLASTLLRDVGQKRFANFPSLG